MPIKIPDDLPARRELEAEGIEVISERDAVRQDIRPLKLALLNLMPEKIKTERQLARLLGGSALQVELNLLQTATYRPTNTPPEHLLAFYKTHDAVRDEKFDGLIITGAPVEELPFEEVVYWQELTEILDWARTNVFSTFNICWGAQAALFHQFGIPKYPIGSKLSGVYPHRLATAHTEILRGFDDVFDVPVSRYTEVKRVDVERHDALDIVAESDEAGVCLIQNATARQFYMFNHLEYETPTLGDEYHRDLQSAHPNPVPDYYFPGDDAAATPVNRWRSHGHLLIRNWVSIVYQGTPFDISKVGTPD